MPKDLQAGAEIAALEGGVGVGFQCRVGLGDRSGFTFDLGFQLHRRIGQIVAFEGLIRRLRRDEGKRQRCAKYCGANQTDHDGTPSRGKRRVSNRSAPKGDGLMAVERRCEKVACNICRSEPLAQPAAGAAQHCVEGGPKAMVRRLRFVA